MDMILYGKQNIHVHVHVYTHTSHTHHIHAYTYACTNRYTHHIHVHTHLSPVCPLSSCSQAGQLLTIQLSSATVVLCIGIVGGTAMLTKKSGLKQMEANREDVKPNDGAGETDQHEGMKG